MNIRIILARFLIHLGKWIQSSAVTVLTPNNLIAFSRQNYIRNSQVTAWSDPQWIESGLTLEEEDLISECPINDGNLFILGAGGGREAIFFAKKGVQVTAVDFIPEMVEQTRKNAATYGVNIRVFCQEISRIKPSETPFDCIWISMGLYSSVPTKLKRVHMLKQLKRSLKPGGVMFCLSHWDPKRGNSSLGELARKIAACLSLNFSYEQGDILWGNMEFIHAFSSETALREEFQKAGFNVKSIHLNEHSKRAGVILTKPAQTHVP